MPNEIPPTPNEITSTFHFFITAQTGSFSCFKPYLFFKEFLPGQGAKLHLKSRGVLESCINILHANPNYHSPFYKQWKSIVAQAEICTLCYYVPCLLSVMKPTNTYIEVPSNPLSLWHIL